MGESSPTAVAVLTGFLGSGKTTLLTSSLRSSGVATAVIVNELASLPIDDLIVREVTDEVLVLPGGCICCAPGSPSKEAIQSLIARRDAGEIPRFDRIVFETSGLADPGAAIAAAITSEGEFPTRLASVVATVDAAEWRRNLQRLDVCRQVASADTILTTKLDIVGHFPSGLRSALEMLNPTALVAACTQGEAGIETLFPASSWAGVARREAIHRFGTDVDHHEEVCTATRQIENPLCWEDVDRWLSLVAAALGDHLLRLKGILSVRGESRPVAVHAVRHTVHEPGYLSSWGRGAPRSSIILVCERLPRSAAQAVINSL